MKNSIYNQKKQKVGEVDTLDKTYYTQRDAKLGQVFHHFGNAVGVDVFILKQLIQMNVKFICILVTNFKQRESFYIVSDLFYFIEHSEKYNYDKRNELGVNYTGYGEQRRMAMDLWKEALTINDVERARNESQAILGEFIKTDRKA